MPAARYFTGTNALGIKSQIEKRIGYKNAEKYFDLLRRFLGLKISKPDFDKLCIGILGRENVRLHNHLLRSILQSACLKKTLPRVNNDQAVSEVRSPTGCQRSNISSLCRDIPKSPRKGRTPLCRDIPRSPRKGRTPLCRDILKSPRKGRTPNLYDCKIGDCNSPLGPYAKQNPADLHTLGSKAPSSVENGEEVDQGLGSPNICSRSLITAPFGICMNNEAQWKRKCLMSSGPTETCYSNGELPDTHSLQKRLIEKLEVEGIKVPSHCANMLNICLDGYLKRLIKPCLDLARSRSVSLQKHVTHDRGRNGLNQMQPTTYLQKPKEHASASMLDFRIAMGMNPSIIGPDWPRQLEKISLHTSDE